MPRTDVDPEPTAADWPPLPYAEWADTRETLQRWTQIVGKTRLALEPMVNHWWQVPFYVSARGLTTSAMPCGARSLEVEFDFLAQQLEIRASDGGRRALPLAARSVADFYAEYESALAALGVPAHIWPVPVEMADALPFAEDREHAAYDPEAAQRFWRVLIQADRVLRAFRARFLGKSSPVHFFWGGFDLAVTRFSGRPAPPHPGGIPNVGDWVMREAYSHEVSSAGFWPGNAQSPAAAFYSYAYPTPPGFGEAPVRPAAAFWSSEMGEFLLPYEAARTAPDPDAAILGFLESTYEAAADRAHWDRLALERSGHPAS
ncbi:MAG TPA: DUF5996 family protein [Thermoanaerobaculia bacterium]|nr:DUF5996 family protein [Thermoanaerobaculia bacterium]